MIGLAGQLMLLIGVAVILLCLIVAVVRGLLFAHRLSAFEGHVRKSLDELQAMLGESGRLREENRRLMQPIRRAQRVLRHPLVGALATSYRTRRKRRTDVYI